MPWMYTVNSPYNNCFGPQDFGPYNEYIKSVVIQNAVTMANTAFVPRIFVLTTHCSYKKCYYKESLLYKVCVNMTCHMT